MPLFRFSSNVTPRIFLVTLLLPRFHLAGRCCGVRTPRAALRPPVAPAALRGSPMSRREPCVARRSASRARERAPPAPGWRDRCRRDRAAPRRRRNAGRVLLAIEGYPRLAHVDTLRPEYGTENDGERQVRSGMIRKIALEEHCLAHGL